VDVASSLIDGFVVALTPSNFGWALAGAIIGTAIGVLPGLGAPATIALLLPVTYRMDSTSAIILLAGIFQGAMYGGSTTSILLRVPGEASSMVTCLDGYALAQQGRAGPALGVAAISSFLAASASLLAMSVIAVPLAGFALRFGPPEYTALVLFGLVAAVSLSHGSVLKGLSMLALGLVLSTVGIDPMFGQVRFTLGASNLTDGFDFVAAGMGLFGISEVLTGLNGSSRAAGYQGRLDDLMPSLADWRRVRPAILRGTGLGFLIGLLPGGGAVMSSFLAYAIEKNVSTHPERFGTGVIEGIAAPEAANNAAATSSFIPMLTLGIPGNSSTAMIFVALLIHGIQPGPLLVDEHPGLFWGVVASMYVANFVLLVLNLPLIWLWVRLLHIPYHYLAVMVIVICSIGAYTIRSAAFDVGVMTAFGVLGFFLRLGGFPVAPLVLALILGPMLERSFVQSLQTSAGALGIFVERPIAAAVLTLTVGLALAPAARRLAMRRAEPAGRNARSPEADRRAE
jgi:putative tricarboxylic transport membrane protein